MLLSYRAQRRAVARFRVPSEWRSVPPQVRAERYRTGRRKRPILGRYFNYFNAMILEYYRTPETGEKWLVVRRIGATSAELWRPLKEYATGAEVLHFAPIDRARLDALVARGLRPKARATASEWYTLTGTGYLNRCAGVTSNRHTTTREPNASFVLPNVELYEYAGEFYE